MTDHKEAGRALLDGINTTGYRPDGSNPVAAVKAAVAQAHATLALAEAADAQVAATLAQNTLLAHLVISQTVTMTARQGELMAQATARIQANADRVKS